MTVVQLARAFCIIVIIVMLVAGVWALSNNDPQMWVPAFIAAGCLTYAVYTGRHKR